MLVSAKRGVTALAGNRNRGSAAAAAGGNGVLNLLIAAAVAGLAVGEVGGVDFVERAARVGVAGDGAVGSHAQHVVAGIDIVGGDGVVAGRTGVGVAETRIGGRMVDGAALHGRDRVMAIGMAGVAFLYVMEAGEQASLGVALGSGATGLGCHIGGVQDVMDNRGRFVGMTVKTGGGVGVGGDDLVNGDAGGGIGVDVAGGVMTGGTGAGAIGGDIMEGLDLVHGG